MFNGDIGHVAAVNAVEMTLEVDFGAQRIAYSKDALVHVGLAYAVTVHKSQGSEFAVVIVPVVMQHFSVLFRDLVYTALPCLWLGDCLRRAVVGHPRHF